jgi:hypothetical protein
LDEQITRIGASDKTCVDFRPATSYSLINPGKPSHAKATLIYQKRGFTYEAHDRW